MEIIELVGWVFLGALILLTVLAAVAFMIAPEGVEDEDGFHEING
jgi:hypothetical protein